MYLYMSFTVMCRVPCGGGGGLPAFEIEHYIGRGLFFPIHKQERQKVPNPRCGSTRRSEGTRESHPRPTPPHVGVGAQNTRFLDYYADRCLPDVYPSVYIYYGGGFIFGRKNAAFWQDFFCRIQFFDSFFAFPSFGSSDCARVGLGSAK